MPIYVYVCPKCGEVIERLKSVADFKEEEVCKCGEKMKHKPTCGSFRMSAWNT